MYIYNIIRNKHNSFIKTKKQSEFVKLNFKLLLN